MSKRRDKLNKLKSEIDFLKKGIDSREDAYNTIYKEKERQMAITKQLTYLFIIINSLYKLTDGSNSPMSRAIRKTLNMTLEELGEGMLSLPIDLTNILNDTDYAKSLQ